MDMAYIFIMWPPDKRSLLMKYGLKQLSGLRGEDFETVYGDITLVTFS